MAALLGCCPIRFPEGGEMSKEENLIEYPELVERMKWAAGCSPWPGVSKLYRSSVAVSEGQAYQIATLRSSGEELAVERGAGLRA